MVNPLKVNNYAAHFNRTTVGRATDSNRLNPNNFQFPNNGLCLTILVCGLAKKNKTKQKKKKKKKKKKKNRIAMEQGRGLNGNLKS